MSIRLFTLVLVVVQMALVNLAMAQSAEGGLTSDEASVAAIASIHESRAVQNAFASIVAMDEHNIERLIEITEIPAPPFKEAERAADFAERLVAAGLDATYIDEVGNVIARRPGVNSQRTIAIVAHLDTVFPEGMEIKVRRDGNVFYAPGISDNSRALVSLLTLVEVMAKHNLQTQDDILFIGSVGEEGLGDLRGVRHLMSSKGVKIDTFIAMDGGSQDRLVVDGVGSNRYRITFTGPGGHSYGAFGRAHPHHALADTIARFVPNAEKITASGPKATFSVGRIGGGTSINSIPFTSWMEIDLRSIDVLKLTALDDALREAVAYALESQNDKRKEDAPLTMEIKSVGARPGGRGDRESSLVAHGVASLQKLGIEPKLRASSTDANIAISMGIPAMTIARGGISRDAHSPDESWENKDSHIAIQAALMLLLAEAGYANP